MKVGTRLLILAAVLAGVFLFLTFVQAPKEGFSAGFDAEFREREDGYHGLREHYDMEIPGEVRQMDPGLMYRAVKDGDVDVINAFATDGRIPAYNLVVLEDDLGFFPPYYAAPLIRKDAVEENPGIKEILNSLAGKISHEKMQDMNYQVDERDEPAREVAENFLTEQGLIGPDVEADETIEGKISVGGKHFTEQEILGEMVALLLEERTALDVERRLNLGGTMICISALEAGDLDVYVEYTGTGLVTILNREMIPDPDESYNVVREVFEEEKDLVWLEPLGFNNSYTLTMRQEHAEKLGIETISELASYLREEVQNR